MTKRKSETRPNTQELGVAGALLGDDEAAWAAYRESAWYGPLQQALRKARRSAGLTQQELAARLRKDQSDISRLEIGLTDRVPIGLIKNFFDACGASFELSVRDQEGRTLLEGAEREPTRLAGDIAAAVLRGLEEMGARFRSAEEHGRVSDPDLGAEDYQVGRDRPANIADRLQALHEDQRPWGGSLETLPPNQRPRLDRNRIKGSVITGRVVAIENEEAVVDVGLKSKVRVPLKEFSTPGHPAEVQVGDPVQVYVERFETRTGEAFLSREQARREESWNKLEQAFKDGANVTGSIFGRVKGGFAVDLGGAVAFLPSSQVDIRPRRDVTPLLNKDEPFRILEMDRRRGNIVVSRRAAVQENALTSRT